MINIIYCFMIFINFLNVNSIGNFTFGKYVSCYEKYCFGELNHFEKDKMYVITVRPVRKSRSLFQSACLQMGFDSLRVEVYGSNDEKCKKKC